MLQHVTAMCICFNAANLPKLFPHVVGMGQSSQPCSLFLTCRISQGRTQRPSLLRLLKTAWRRHRRTPWRTGCPARRWCWSTPGRSGPRPGGEPSGGRGWVPRTKGDSRCSTSSRNTRGWFNNTKRKDGRQWNITLRQPYLVWYRLMVLVSRLNINENSHTSVD